MKLCPAAICLAHTLSLLARFCYLLLSLLSFGLLSGSLCSFPFIWLYNAVSEYCIHRFWVLYSSFLLKNVFACLHRQKHCLSDVISLSFHFTWLSRYHLSQFPIHICYPAIQCRCKEWDLYYALLALSLNQSLHSWHSWHSWPFPSLYLYMPASLNCIFSVCTSCAFHYGCTSSRKSRNSVLRHS